MSKMIGYQKQDEEDLDDDITDEAARRALKRWRRHNSAAEQFGREMESKRIARVQPE